MPSDIAGGEHEVVLRADHQARHLDETIGDARREVPVAIHVPVVVDRRGERAGRPERLLVDLEHLGWERSPVLRHLVEEDHVDEVVGAATPREHPLGEPRFLELDDVDRGVDEDLTQQLDGRHVRAREIRRVHTDDPGGELRIHPGELPDEQPAPIVSREHRVFVTERVDQSREATVDELDVVRDVGLVGTAVSRKIGRDDVEPGGCDRVDLVSPRVRELGKTVAKEHQRLGARLPTGLE